MRTILILVMGVLMAGAVAAGDNGIVRKEATGDVAGTVDALVETMEEAGITIFARVDHGAGAQSIGADIGASQLLIFGNPKVGTPAMQDDPVAGLFLPLKVLVYEDGTGKVMIAYEEPAAMLGRLGGVPEDAAYLQTMAGALAKFTGTVAQ